MKCLLPIRLVLLLCHLVLNILLLTNRASIVRACIDWDYSEDAYHWKDAELLVGLILSIVILSLESLSFLSGLSMLPAHRRQSLFSSCAHGLGSLTLACFMWDWGWQCGLFWWIFGLTIVIPALSETSVVARLSLTGSGGGQWRHRVQS